MYLKREEQVDLQVILSKIVNTNIKERLLNIANADGGPNKDAIDSPKGYEQLCELLSGAPEEDMDVLLGLKLDCEKNINKGKKAQNIKNQNNTNSGNNVGLVAGNVVNGNNNTVGGDNSVNISGSHNNVNVTINVHSNSDEEKEFKINVKSKRKGNVQAVKVHNETIKSFVAFNNRIVNAINKLDENSAYSFVKEYKRKTGNPQILQDIYNVNDFRNVITLKEASHLINALLKQAESIGLSDIEAYRSLQKQLETIENSTDDPVGDQDIHLDYAIDELMQEMSKKLE